MLIEALESRRVLATYFVDTTVDDLAGVCAADDPSGNNSCSISAAIAAAEANPGADTISIPDGTYIPDNTGGFDVEGPGDLTFLGNVADPSAVVIDGDNRFRLFDMFSFGGTTFNVRFEAMTLQNGVANDGSGGAAINSVPQINLTVDNVLFQNNLADRRFDPDPFFQTPSDGGAIQASGNVTVLNSTFIDNAATDSGGAIDFVPFGDLSKNLFIRDSTFSGNVAGDPSIDLGVGGAIFARNQTNTNVVVTIRDSDFDGNTAGDSGGGVYALETDASFFDTSFSNNQALGSDSGGGGVYVLGDGTRSPFVVQGGSFISNSAVMGAGGFESVNNNGELQGVSFELNQVTGTGTDFRDGGGAVAVISTNALSPSTVTLRNLFVSENSAPSAGGIAAVDANLIIEDSIITANSATEATLGSAGGIGAVADADGRSLVIRRSSILSNSATLQAGGVGTFDVDVDISYSLVDANVAATGRAGGIGLAGRNLGSNPTLSADSVTVSNNSAGGDGGGIGVDNAGLDLVNATVTGNQSISGNGGGVVFVNALPGTRIDFSTIASNTGAAGSNVAAQNSTVEFSSTLLADGTGAALGSTFQSLGNNLDQSGTFGLAGLGDISGVDPLLGTLQDNGGLVPTRALQPGSPAIDAGAALPPSLDARGALRPLDGDGLGGAVADIGAFELDSAVSLVVDNASDIDDGDFTPGNLTLREAVRIVNENGSLAQSTIAFDGTVFGVPQTITLLGTALDVTRSVDIQGPGQNLLTISGDDLSRIFSFRGELTDAAVSGVTLTEGAAIDNFPIDNGSGGAILVESSSLTISDSTITGNRSDNTGGAISDFSGSGSSGRLFIRDSVISGNSSQANGGAIESGGTLEITDSSILNNSAMGAFSGIGYGGAIDTSGVATLTRAILRDNSASEDGGAISASGMLTIFDGEVTGNTAQSFGGGIAIFEGVASIDGALISNNDAGDSGGGVFNSGSTVSLTRSTLSGNTAVDQGGGAFNYVNGTLSVVDSTISGNSALGSGGGLYSNDSQLLMSNSTVSGNFTNGHGGGIVVGVDGLDPSTASIVNSTIVGNQSDFEGDGNGEGGIYIGQSSFVMTYLFNTIVAGNTTGPSDVTSPSDLAGRAVESASVNNLIGDPATAGSLTEGVNGNLVGDGSGGVLLKDQILDPILADNGGSTLTHALVSGSRAIDSGNDALATTPGDDGLPGTGDSNEVALVDDQRGSGFSRIRGVSVDIGAFETDATTPRLRIDDVIVSEADGIATIVVSLLDPADDPFTLGYSTIEGLAFSPDDFIDDSGTIDFNGDQFEQQTFEVVISDDGIAEGRESFEIELTVVSASQTLDVSDIGLVTIDDDDEAVLSVSDVEIDEADGFLTVEVELFGETDESFTVDFSTGQFFNDAEAGVDYESTFETLFFSGFDGEIQTFTVDVNDDLVVEGDEEFAIVGDFVHTNGSNVHFEQLQQRVDVFQLNQFDPAGISSNGVALDQAGDIAYVTDSAGLYVVDVTNSLAPQQLGFYASSFGASDVEVVGNVAYIIGDGLELLDVSDPSSITRLGQYSHPSLFISSLDVVGTSVYLGLTDSFSTSGGIAVVDVSDSTNVQLLGEASAGGVSDIAADGSVAFVTETFGGFVSFDVSDPTSISSLGSLDIREGFEIALSGTEAYVGNSDGLRSVDVSDPANMFEVGYYATLEDVISIAVEFDIGSPVVYLGYLDSDSGDGVIEVVDATDSASLQRFGRYDGLTVPLGITADNGLIYVADANSGLRTLFADTVQVNIATIVNDDSATLTVSDVTVNENEGTASVTVTLDNEVQDGFSYDFTTVDGSAIQGSDYTFTDGTNSSGSAGEQQTILIPIVSDALGEPDETFTVFLSNVTPFGSVLSDSIDATDFGTVTITEPTGVDLAITKADSLDPVEVGDGLTYTILVTNNGTLDATGVTVSDLLPDGLAFQSGDVDGDESLVSEDAGLVIGDVGDLGIGESVTVTINVVVEPTAIHPLSNTASVSSNETDADTSDNEVTELTGVDDFAAIDDVFVVLEDSLANPLDVIANDLPGLAGPLTIINAGPANSGIVNVAADGFSLFYSPDADSNAQDVFSYTVQDSGGNTSTADVTINVTPVNDPPIAEDDEVDASDRGAISIAISELLSNDSAGPGNEPQTPAFVSADTVSAEDGTVTVAGGFIIYTPDPDFAGVVDTFSYTMTDGVENDDATVTINLPPLADVDLATSISDDVDPVGPGEIVTFTVPISNLGTDAATGVLVTTEIAAGFSIESVNVSPLGSATFSGNTVTATVGALDGGAATTLTIVAISGPNGGSYVSSTSVTASEADIDPSDNSDSETTQVAVSSSIFGHVFCDDDSSGAEDPGEEVAGLLIFLDTNGDRIRSSGERSVLTNSAGDYLFDNVTEPFVTVVAEVPDGCNTIPTNPGVVRSTIGVGDLARSIANADIDNDGDLDLLIASDGSDSLTILENDGGSFSLFGEIALADRPQSVAAWQSDLNETPLIAVAGVGTPSNAGGLFVFEFGSAPKRIAVGNGPIDVEIDDFDGNGVPDILVGTLRSSDVQLFMNGAETPELIAFARQVRTVTAGDVNGDGSADIVIGGFGYTDDPESDLLVLLGDGAGGFADPIAETLPQELVEAKVVDLTFSAGNDADTRVLALSAAGELSVFELVGDALVKVSDLAVSPGSNAFDVGNFNGDAFTDVAVSNQGQQVIELFAGDGAGGFSSITKLTDVPAPSDLAVGDYDLDDKLDDIAVTNFYQDANAGVSDTPAYFLPSAVTILRLDVAEVPIITGEFATQVDFAFASADPTVQPDVNDDGRVTALDALRVINALARQNLEGEFVQQRTRESTDVNGDGRTTAVDALMVINLLLARERGELSQYGIDLLSDDEDEDRVSAVDVVFSNLLF